MTSNHEENLVYVKREENNVVAPKLWILIEYRSGLGNNKNEGKSYEVIDAKDVCGAGGRGNPKLEAMHTGKIVYVKRDTILVQAAIVIISDDKHFLESELNDLMKLQMEENSNQKKRKRTITSKAENSFNQYQRWGSRDSACSPTQSIIMTNASTQKCPPMTFDQQTQTDIKINFDNSSSDSKMTKILTNEESILRLQHNITLENQEIKQQVFDLGDQLAEVKSMLREILLKVDYPREDLRSAMNENQGNNSMMGHTPNKDRPVSTNPPRILNLSHAIQPSQQYYNNLNIEPVEATNDSYISYSNNSRMSLSISNQSLYHNDLNSSINQSGMNNSDQNSSIHSAKIEHNSSSVDTFGEDDGNPDEEVVIGNNNTTIPRNVLANINWNSHTAATRRLLRAKFSREVLATHSLTGKPSPAFIESSKPTKNQLDPNVIADIVQYVSRRCKVTDTAVRSSITTKCADENKMMRQRMEKDRKVLTKIENKENFANRK